MAGTFSIENAGNLGTTLTGSFDVPFTPVDDPNFGADGIEPTVKITAAPLFRFHQERMVLIL